MSKNALYLHILVYIGGLIFLVFTIILNRATITYYKSIIMNFAVNFCKKKKLRLLKLLIRLQRKEKKNQTNATLGNWSRISGRKVITDGEKNITKIIKSIYFLFR